MKRYLVGVMTLSLGLSVATGIDLDTEEQLAKLRRTIELNRLHLPGPTKVRIESLYNDAAKEHGKAFTQAVDCTSIDRCLLDLNRLVSLNTYSSKVAKLHWTIATYTKVRDEVAAEGVPSLTTARLTRQSRTALIDRKISLEERFKTLKIFYFDFLTAERGMTAFTDIKKQLANLNLWAFTLVNNETQWWRWVGVCDSAQECKAVVDEYASAKFPGTTLTASWLYNPSPANREAAVAPFREAIQTLEEMANHYLILNSREITKSELGMEKKLASLPFCETLQGEWGLPSGEVSEATPAKHTEFQLSEPEINTRSLLPGESRNGHAAWTSKDEPAPLPITKRFIIPNQIPKGVAGGCFARGTSITVLEKGKALATSIEQIHPGDRVLGLFSSRRLTVPQVCWDLVTHTYERPYFLYGKPVIEITYAATNAKLVSTPLHPYLKKRNSGNGAPFWAEAQMLNRRESLVSLSESLGESEARAARISSVRQLRVEDPIWDVGFISPRQVYNLTTSVTHTYFIGIPRDAVLSHNFKY